MNRRDWICGCIAGSLAGWAMVRTANAEETVSLKNTLEKGLYCRRPLEFEFVGLVVQKVAEKKLQQELVLSMFKWSRERRPDRPFPYFQAALRQRAAALGVDL